MLKAIEAFEILHRPWMLRVTRLLARGEELRESFAQIMEGFYNSLRQAIETGDPAWLDPQIEAWVESYTQTDIDDREFSLLSLLHQIHSLTLEIARENLSDADALTLIGELIPIFAHAAEHTARLLLEKSIEHIARDLESANQALQQLDKSKSNFIAIAAHELKTPLTLIEGYTSMLREGLPQGEAYEASRLILHGMDNGSRRLREIIDNMIDISLIDNNLLSLHFQPMWINRLLAMLEEEFRPAVTERKQTLSIQPFAGWDTLIFGDDERLYQALRNVLSNSVKYTPDGGQIIVGGRQLPGFSEITFADSGIGIDPDDQAHIFDKFANLGNVSLHSSGKTKFKGGGPGLGLSIARGIIEAHGGTIWVDSPGHDEIHCLGTTFHILLPMRLQPPDDRTAKLFAALTSGAGLHGAEGQITNPEATGAE